MELSSPLDDAFSYLFEEFLVLRKAEWKADKEFRAVKAFMEVLQRDPDEAADFLHENYSNSQDRSAFVEALEKYRWDSEANAPRRIRDSMDWGSPDAIGNNDDIFNMLREFHEARDSEIYSTNKLWKWVERDRERDEHVRNGIECPHCDHGIRPIQRKGSQDVSAVSCKFCRGTGFYEKGGKLRSAQHAAEIKQRLTDSGNNAWLTEPSERAVEAELRAMMDSIDSETRELARNENLESEALAVARQRIKNKTLLPDPRTLNHEERLMALARLRLTLADMKAWELVERVIEEDPDDSISEEHQDAVDRIYEEVNARVYDADEQIRAARSDGLGRIEQIVARRKEAYQGSDFDEVRAEHEALMSIFKPLYARALHNYFLPYTQKAIDENVNYVTSKAYLNSQNLDIRVDPDDMDVIEQVRAEQAGEWLENIWGIATSSTGKKLTGGVFYKENPITGIAEEVTQAHENLYQIENIWRDLVSGTLDNNVQAEKMLEPQVEIGNNVMPLLTFILLVGERQGNLPANTRERFAETMAKSPHPISKLSPAWKDKDWILDNFLKPKSARGIRRDLEQSQMMGEGVRELSGEEGLGQEGEVDLGYDTELDDSLEAPEMGDSRPAIDDTGPVRDFGFPAIKSYLIPTGIVENTNEEHQPTFLQAEDRLRRHMGTDDLSGPMREMLRTYYKLMQGKKSQNIADRASLKTSSAETRKALLELTGEGDFGHQYRHWLDQLIHTGRFKEKELVRIGGGIETNYRKWNRMKKLVDILLDRHTGEERDYDEVAKNPEFMKILSRDKVGENPIAEFKGGLRREEREQVKRLFSLEDRAVGRSRPCPKCDDTGRDKVTMKPCKNVIGEGDDIARCSGMTKDHRIGRGRLIYDKPFRPTADSSKKKIDDLRMELLGSTKYVLRNKRNGKHTEIEVVGKADPDYVPPEGMEVLEVGGYIPGLIQEAHDYDKEAAHSLGYMTLCPRCKGTGAVEGMSCPSCSNSKYTKIEDGKRYIPDTRMLRELNSGSRESGVSNTQSAMSMNARRKALSEYALLEMRRRGGT